MNKTKIGLLSLTFISFLKADMHIITTNNNDISESRMIIAKMPFGPQIIKMTDSQSTITTIIPKDNSSVMDGKENVTSYILPKINQGKIKIKKDFDIDFCGEQTYLISVGINQYKNISRQLKGSIDDAKNIVEKITTQCPNTETHLLLDKKASKINIIKILNQVHKKAKKNDSILFFYSANGLNFKSQNYLVTYDSVLLGKTPKASSLLSTSEVKKYINLNKIKIGVMIFDVCTKIFHPNK